MLPFGVTIPATVPQRSGIPEGLTNYPVYPKKKARHKESKLIKLLKSRTYLDIILHSGEKVLWLPPDTASGLKAAPFIASTTFLFAWFRGNAKRVHHLQKTLRVYWHKTKHTMKSATQRRKWMGHVLKWCRQRKCRKPRESCVQKSSVPLNSGVPPEHKSEYTSLFFIYRLNDPNSTAEQ